jgi:DNA-binding response OmpR family regulator
MYVPVYPASPSAALTAAIIETGNRPVPIDAVTHLTTKRPREGWGVAVVEISDDAGIALSTARKIHSDHALPVLLVLDRVHTEDLEEQAGFDDFLLSPIDADELRIRLSRLRSTSGNEPGEETLYFQDLVLNTATYQATVDGNPRDLTYMEYELLRFFVENPGRVWSREQILSRVWGYDYFGGSRTVDVHVRRLRAKLGEERSSWITTVRSVGYRFG